MISNLIVLTYSIFIFFLASTFFYYLKPQITSYKIFYMLLLQIAINALLLFEGFFNKLEIPQIVQILFVLSGICLGTKYIIIYKNIINYKNDYYKELDLDELKPFTQIIFFKDKKYYLFENAKKTSTIKNILEFLFFNSILLFGGFYNPTISFLIKIWPY